MFTRQKTYIEHVIAEDLEPIEKPYNNIKCAGMPQKCKDLFELSMQGTANYNEMWSDDERNFLFDENNKPIKRDFSDFKIGLSVPDKLRPKRILGGILLVETTYQMH